MKNPIELLFRSSKASAGSDRLNQKQREAMIDLLVFAMYADNHLAISEDKIIKDEIDSFNWESTVTAEH